MKALYNQIKFQKDLYVLGGLVVLGMYIFGTILHDILMVSGDEVTSVFYMGSMMAVIGLFLIIFFFSGVHMVINFNYAVSMGQSRKRVIPAYLLATFLTCFVLAIGTKLLYALEGIRLGLMFKGLPQEDIIGAVLEWKYLLVFAFVGTAITALAGATLTKFGKAAFLVWWLLLMLVCIVGPRVAVYLEKTQPDGAVMNFLVKTIEFFVENGPMAVVGVVLCVSALFLGIAYVLLRRQQVTL